MTSGVTVRPARRDDVPAVVAMVHELAEFERAPQDCHLTTEQASVALFGDPPAAYAHVAVDRDDRPVGLALWYLTFSTWTGQQGIHLEDLYVRPAARGTGAGRLLMAALAAVCAERGYTRLEWVMLDWNPAATFYDSLGAQVVSGWSPYRLTGPALHHLARRADPVRPALG